MRVAPTDSPSGTHTLAIAKVPAAHTARFLTQLIHIPGIRATPERSYQVGAVADSFPGTFDKYVASIIHKWGSKKSMLSALSKNLERLGLTWKITTEQISDTEVKVRVGRSQKPSRGGNADLVNIADVGFGISQVLPILTALLTSNKNTTIYIEQPEIHLHPKAQVALAEIICEEAEKGKCIIIETHSPLMLTTIQSMAAEGRVSNDRVSLYWFERDQLSGFSNVSKGQIDDAGAFGNWPEDFGEISLFLTDRYLTASEKVLFREMNKPK